MTLISSRRLSIIACIPCLAAWLAWPSLILAQPLAPSLVPNRAVDFAEACEDGVVQDDGSAETGYGWVPSAVDGVYVQRILGSQFQVLQLETVCVCWLRTQSDSSLDFEIVAYAEEDGKPALTPYASIPAHADNVPSGVTGRFYEVNVEGLTISPGTSYIGVRWNPSADQFFFVCTDTSPDTAPVEAFFIDDRATDWGSVFTSRDPIFDEHRAILVRVQSRFATILDVPTLGSGALALFILLLSGVALGVIRTHHLF